MRYYIYFFALLIMGVSLMTSVQARAQEKTAYDFSFKTLVQQDPLPLSDYKGKVIMIVNTASECGFTPQYEGLQKIYDQYKDRGFVVIAVPANDFGGQEPGSAKQIAEF